MAGINRVGNQANVANNRPEPVAKKAEVKPETTQDNFRNSKTSGGAFQADFLKAKFNKTFDSQTPTTPGIQRLGGGGALPQKPTTPDPTTNGKPPVDQAKVDDALKLVRDRLDQSAFDWDVTHGDLKDIENKFKELNSSELNKTFESLSPDELKRYASELNGKNGEYSADEKKQLFDHLAENLDGKNLAKFAAAMDLGKETDDVRPDQQDEPDVNILARSIAENASPEAKAEFVKNFAAQAEEHQDAGVAAAQVLASMKDNPALLQETLKNLPDNQLQAIVDGAARKTEVSTRGGTVTNYDPQPLRDLLDAASTMQGEGSAHQKSRLFGASAEKLTEIQENATRFGAYYGKPAEDLIRGGLTNVLKSDTNGVVTLLENYNNGSAMTAYLKSAINAGEHEQIRGFISNLTTGNGTASPTEHIERDFGTPGKPIFQNARSLGFFAGSLFAATEQIADDVEQQVEIVKNVLGVGFGAAGAANPASGVVASLANGITAEAARNILDGVNADAENAREQLGGKFLELFLPPDATGIPYSGTAKTDFNASFGITAALNDPN